MSNLQAVSDAAVELHHLYSDAQVNYSHQFLLMYIAYNAWYREATGYSNDRQAIGALKKRFVIWDDYRMGKTMTTLRPYFEKLADFTQREAFPSMTMYWDGEFASTHDWRALIEFWYQVRCLVVHGSSVKSLYTWLAYETLDIFMDEIITRMHRVRKQQHHPPFNMWQVDMERVGETSL